MRKNAWHLCAGGLLLVVACGSDDSSTFTDAGDVDAATEAAPPAYTIRVDPPSASLTIDIANKAALTASYHAFEKDPSTGVETDVTQTAVWSVDKPAIATASKGIATTAGIGGQTKVHASIDGATGAADLIVKLTGDVYGPGTDPTTKTKFSGATVDPNPADAPAIEYPEDGVVLPANLPAIELQWTQAADNALYRAHLVSGSVLDVYLYGSARELTPDAASWTTITASVPDAPTTLTVDGLGASNQLRTSAPRTLTVTADAIDQSAIYVWQSSTGSFHVIDITQAKDFPLPTSAPELAGGQPCSGCHRISRDGKRFSYTFNGGNFEFGTLKFDPTTKTYVPKVAPQVAVRATYATFNPNEATEVPAMLVTVPDDVPQNTAGTVRLELRDPETYAPVASDLPAMMAALDPTTPGRATSMPDWSPDGSFVVFSAYDSDKNFVRLLGDDIVLASIVESPVSYDATTKSFHFGAPKVLVAADSNANPDTGQNNVLPAISPDGSAVAFTRAAGWWSIKTQVSLLNLSGQIEVVRRSDGHVFDLVKGSNGPGTTLSATWPQWAPTLGARYAWLAFGSERPYGHEMTPANHSCGSLVQGQGSCKQLWVMAVDRDALKNGMVDPSSAPFWIPGQNIHAQYVSPQWTQAVITPPN